MGSSSIQAKIKKGLSRAINKTGSSSSELVYLVSESRVGGDGVTPPTITKANVLLKDAIFKSYDASMLDTNILIGDRMLVSNNDLQIVQGYTISQGSKEYIVIDVDIKAPTSDTLVYISQLREK